LVHSRWTKPTKNTQLTKSLKKGVPWGPASRANRGERDKEKAAKEKTLGRHIRERRKNSNNEERRRGL